MKNEIKQVLETATRHHLSLIADTMQVNESGLDFRVVLARDEEGIDWVLRMPRRPDVMPRTKVEKQALDLVNRYVKGFQAPEWVVYTEELIAYRKLAGVPAGTIDPEIGNYRWEMDSANVPAAFTTSLGRVLAELHSIPVDKAREAGLANDTAEEVRSSMDRRMARTKAKFGVSDALWARWQAWLKDDAMWPQETRFIHGDVHAGHAMIDEEARVTGLIDWTEAKVSDVSSDFVFQYMAFGEDGLRALIHAYRAAGGYTWPKMKEHIIELAAAYPVSIAEFAEISGLEEYTGMAKAALGVKDA